MQCFSWTGGKKRDNQYDCPLRAIFLSNYFGRGKPFILLMLASISCSGYS